jgi:HEAT repeat protein
VTRADWQPLAARTLKDMASASLVGRLLEDLDHAANEEGSELGDVFSTVSALVAIHPEAVLERLEASESRKMRRILLDALPQAGPALLPLLRSKLHSPSWFVVRNAIGLIPRSGGTAKELTSVIRHPNEKVRLEIARALHAVPLDESVVEIAATYLADPALEVRIQARGLVRGELAGPTAILILERVAADEQQPEDVRHTAIDALTRCPHDQAAAALFQLLQPRGLIDLGSMRDLVALGLFRSRAPGAAALFEQGLRSQAWRVRKACEHAVKEGR